jgi:hypothetical protein
MRSVEKEVEHATIVWMLEAEMEPVWNIMSGVGDKEWSGWEKSLVGVNRDMEGWVGWRVWWWMQSQWWRDTNLFGFEVSTKRNDDNLAEENEWVLTRDADEDGATRYG